MAFTGHGHQIDGTPRTGTPPKQKSRCGGPGLCAPCADDVLRRLIKNYTPGEEDVR